MKSIDVKAYAKLNLSLDVLGKMPDGYHEMLMIMQTVDLCDDISIELIEGSDEISAASNLGFLPSNMDNLACKAAKEFLFAAGIKNTGARISINKRIPVCAGLGGGSSDAAAVIRGLNELTGAGFSAGVLEIISKPIGSDVPFCVSGGTVKAYGRGEKLSRIADLPDCSIVICKPQFSVSTPELFSKIDSYKIKQRPDTDGLIEALNCGDITGVSRRLFNVFEDALPAREQRTVGSVKDVLLSYGALGACMTGTGSAVFGIFSDNKKAEEAKNRLSEEYRECFLVRPVKKII